MLMLKNVGWLHIMVIVLEVRLVNQYYQVDECNDAVVEVCAIVDSATECPISFLIPLRNHPHKF